MAIDFGATLTIDDSVVDDHAVTSNFNGGSIPIAEAYGAGILNNGTLTVQDTYLHHNTLASSLVQRRSRRRSRSRPAPPS